MTSLLSFLLLTALTAPGADAFTNFTDVVKAAWADHDRNKAFILNGQIIAWDGSSVILSDEQHQLVIAYDDTILKMPRPGSIITLHGHLHIGPNGLLLRKAESLEINGYYPLTDPIDINAEDIVDPKYVNRRVRITGVISAARHDIFDPRYNWMVLRTKNDPLCVVVQSSLHPINELQNIVGAKVSLDGYVIPFSDISSSSGVFLSIPQKDGIVILAKPIGNPEDLKTDDNRSNQFRTTLSGTVLASCENRFFIQTKDHPCLTVYPIHIGEHPLPGDILTVTGFAEQTRTTSRLADAYVLQSTKCLTPPEVHVVDGMDAVLDTNIRKDEFANLNNGKIIKISGTILGNDLPSRSGTFTLIHGSHQFTVDTSGIPFNSLPDIQPGSRIELTGLCLTEYECLPSNAYYPTFRNCTIVPRTSSDIRLLAGPPWLSPRMLLIIMCILFCLLLAVGIWNHILKTLVEKRSRQLFREQIEHEKTILKIEERTRLAIELHDAISQTLTGVALQIDSACLAYEQNNASVIDFLNNSAQMLASCRHELKNCLWDLRSRTFEELNLTDAILRTLEPHRDSANVIVRFNVPRKKLSESAMHTVLRITRELTVNAVSHGHASLIKIAGEYHQGTLSFSVRDNGKGFDPSTAPDPTSGHFGLVGIRERIRAFNGNMNIDSIPECGTKITITMRITPPNFNE